MPVIIRHKSNISQQDINAVSELVSLPSHSILLHNLSKPYIFFKYPDSFDASDNFIITLSILLNSPGINDDQTILEQGNVNQFAMIWSNRNENVRVISNGATVLSSPLTHKISKETAYDLSLEYVKNSSTLDLYINKELVSSNILITNPPKIISPLYFGCRVSSNDYPLSGLLSNITISK